MRINIKKVKYTIYCDRFKNKIKEIDLDRLGKSYECCIAKFKKSITFEQYIDMRINKGYKII